MSYLIIGYSSFATFSLADCFARLFCTALYLKIRNPIRPTWKEWLWSIPSNLFYNVPLPAVQVFSFFTMFHDGWGGAMRGGKEVQEKSTWSQLKKKMWEMGFLVVWMGRYRRHRRKVQFSEQMGWEERWQLLTCIVVGMSSMFTGFGFWMVTTE